MEPASNPQSAYRSYGPALVRKAQRILGNREDAIDIVHSLFADLIARTPTDEAALDLPYLYRAVTNRSLNQLRNHATHARLLAETPVVPMARVRCDDAVIGGNLLARLAQLLDEGQMEVLVARFVDDMTQDEVAAHLGVSRKTVGNRLRAIRIKVAELRGVTLPADIDDDAEVPS